jgi:hypothetical protein
MYTLCIDMQNPSSSELQNNPSNELLNIPKLYDNNREINNKECDNLFNLFRSNSSRNDFRSYKNNTDIMTYIIKIDDSYKVVSNSIEQNELIDLIYRIYCNSDVTIYSLPKKDYTNTLSRLKLKNSFIENEINDMMEFCENLVKSANLDHYFTNFTKLDSPDNIEVKQIDIKHGSSITSIHPDYNINLEVNDCVQPYNDMSYVNSLSDGIYSSNIIYKEYNNKNDNSDNLFPVYKVYFNTMQNNINIYQFSINRVKDIFPEMIEIYSGKLTDEQFNDISELINEVYVNEEDAKLSINKVVYDKVLSTKLSFGELKRLINKYFVLDNNIENKIKFTNIWNIITKNFNISEQYIGYYKHQLPIVLEGMGLSKKRYSDGMYWYGLTEKNVKAEKENTLQKKSVDNPITEDEYKEKISSRNNQSDELKNLINNSVKLIDNNLKKIFN